MIRIRPTTTRALNERLSVVTEDVCICAGDVDCQALRDAVAEREKLNVHFAGASVDCVLLPGKRGDHRRPRTVRAVCGACLYATYDVIRHVGALDERLPVCAALVEWQLEAYRQFGAKPLWVPSVWCDAECPVTPCEELERLTGAGLW